MALETEARNKIIKEVNDAFYSSKKCSAIRTRIRDGTATTSDLYKLADYVGEFLSKSLKANFNGTLNENQLETLAVQSIRTSLSGTSELLGKEYMLFQDSFNKKLKTNLKALEYKPNESRIKGFCDRVASDPASMEWMSEAPAKNYARSIIIEQIKNNAEFLNKAGFEVTITRKLGPGGCCEWCKRLAGTYTMPNIPSEVFQAHDRCDCEVEVTSADGSYFMRKSGHRFSKY